MHHVLTAARQTAYINIDPIFKGTWLYHIRDTQAEFPLIENTCIAGICHIYMDHSRYGMGSAKERRCYNVTTSLIGPDLTHNNPCMMTCFHGLHLFCPPGIKCYPYSHMATPLLSAHLCNMKAIIRLQVRTRNKCTYQQYNKLCYFYIHLDAYFSISVDVRVCWYQYDIHMYNITPNIVRLVWWIRLSYFPDNHNVGTYYVWNFAQKLCCLHHQRTTKTEITKILLDHSKWFKRWFPYSHDAEVINDLSSNRLFKNPINEIILYWKIAMVLLEYIVRMEVNILKIELNNEIINFIVCACFNSTFATNYFVLLPSLFVAQSLLILCITPRYQEAHSHLRLWWQVYGNRYTGLWNARQHYVDIKACYF